MNQQYDPETEKFLDRITKLCALFLIVMLLTILVVHTGIIDTPEQQYERMIFRETRKMSELHDRQQSNEHWNKLQKQIKTSCSYNEGYAQF